MLRKIGNGIIKYKGIILFVFLLLFAVSAVGTVFLVLNRDEKINSDISSYLSEDSQTKQGLRFLEEEFDIRGYATFVIRVDENNNGKAQLTEKINKLLQNKKITAVTWYGTLETVDGTNQSLDEIIDVLADNKDYLSDSLEILKGNGLLSDVAAIKAVLELANYADTEVVDVTSMQNYLRQGTGEAGVYDYVLLIMLSTDGTGEESYALLDGIKEEFSYTAYASAGTIETAERLLYDTLEDLPWFLIAGILIVFAILFLTSSGLIEPFIVLISLFVGIVISMGMNYLFPSVSIISFAISSVLQLAITVDYAVFYAHIYNRKREKENPLEATGSAFKEATGSILASGLTTVGGFVALYFMQFSIGADMANVLIKGILLSVLTVLIVQPVLTFIWDKNIQKFSYVRLKKDKKPKRSKGFLVKPIAKFSVFARIVIVVLAVGLLVPCYLAQSNVPYSYLELYEKSDETSEDRLSNELGNQLILAVPYEIQADGKTHRDFLDEIKKTGGDRIGSILSPFEAVKVDEEILSTLLELTESDEYSLSDVKTLVTSSSFQSTLETYGIEDPERLATLCKDLVTKIDGINLSGAESYFRKIDGKWYTLYSVSFNGNAEDEEAQEIYSKIVKLCDGYFGKNTCHAIGMVISGYEMAQITPNDFLTVTLVSAAIIFLIVLLLLKNPLKSLLIVVLIELGIWINLSFSYLAGESINFIVYIIISSVELGCTVDYAILFANTFEKNRDLCKTGKECAILTATEAVPSILTGALMICGVCTGMYFISGNIIIRQLVGILARGAGISFLLVTVVMTAIWSFFPTKRKKVDYASKLQSVEEELSKNTKK